jgi:hypothetical protein
LGEWLTGEASRKERGSSVEVSWKSSYIFVDGHIWPVLLEDFLAPLILFAECDCAEACPFCGKAKASNSCEEIDMG